MSISVYPAVLIVLAIGIFAGALWLAYSLGYRRAAREFDVILDNGNSNGNGARTAFGDETES